MNCPICETAITVYTRGVYRSEEINTTVLIYYCKHCNSFIKKVDNDLILSYFTKPVYSDLNYEEKCYANRIDFFKNIYSLTKKQKNVINNWLDFGCSYGHFIDFLNKKEISSCGVEISEEVRNYGNMKGLKIYRGLDDIPENVMFEVVSFIDSFYYLATPKILLTQVYKLMLDNGLLVLRVVNRNWLVKFNKHIRYKKTCYSLIDHVIGYSRKSILYLLKSNGFEVLKTTYIERGKYRSNSGKVLYFLVLFIYVVSIGLLNFLPGMIIIARKKPDFVTS